MYCWKVPDPVVAKTASAAESSNAGGTGFLCTAEAAAAMKDTTERIEAFMVVYRLEKKPRARQKSLTIEGKACFYQLHGTFEITIHVSTYLTGYQDLAHCPH